MTTQETYTAEQLKSDLRRAPSVRLAFGALAPTLRSQLAGARVLTADLARWQRQSDLLIELLFAGLLTEVEVRRARGRLVKHISAAHAERGGGR